MVNSGRIIRVPLEMYRVRGISFPLVRAVIPLAIRTGPRQFREIPFVVDSGAAVTTLPTTKAVELGIPVPRRAVEITVETAVRQVRQLRRPSRIQVKLPGLEASVYDWPCHFVEPQGTPPRAVLGLAGVLDDLRITFDGSYSLEARYGWMLLESRSHG
jgi:hypothetical protein